MWAEGEFSGVRPHAKGGTESDHIKALKKMGAKIEDTQSEFPYQLRYLYDIYLELRFARTPKGDEFALSAKAPLNNHDLQYYSQLKGLEFNLWEVKCIMSLDTIFERCVN